MKRKNKFIVWPVVIIWFLLFMPVGIYMFHKKMKTDKEGAKINSKIMVAIGIIILLLNCYYYYWFKYINSYVDISEAIPGIIMLTAISIHMFLGSRRVNAAGVRFQRYMELIVENHETNIDRIAAMMSRDNQQAVKELQEIIDAGYLEDSYLYDDNHRIFLSQRFRISDTNYEAEKTKNSKVVICESCGGRNTVITGTVSECEYCKTPLS